MALTLFTSLGGTREAKNNEIVLHRFQGGNDGSEPFAGLIADSAGNFYGTTYLGGGTGCPNNAGCGMVFKITPAGNQTVLYSFKGGTDGSIPVAV